MADKEAGGGDTGPRETAPTSAYSSPARSLGDTGITPLSPSHIANDADPNVSEQQTFLVVVAIDFGTTSSGYAYSFAKEPECIHVMRRWEGGDPGVSNQKTPTTILLTPERKFHSFGYAARDFYHDLDPNEAKQWLYLEKFKMKLHTTGVSEPLPAPSPPRWTAEFLQPCGERFFQPGGPSGFSRAEIHVRLP
uniref:Heat shock protein family A (Hsp70) member 12A n=1 Tax=Rousettus aegyptiacus TaxID=9407 RepID=A0A7J8G9A2_ROUAE|nr:heat shock protein family A (Hsp70) member 12A [Rousettus aegyptiacus]